MMSKYLRDKGFLLGLGIGLIICALIISTYPKRDITKDRIEQMARDMGMMYPSEIKAYFNSQTK